MSGRVESHESEIAIALDLADLLSISTKFEILHFDFIVGLLARPFQCFSPGLVAKPVANKVRVALVNEVSILVGEARGSKPQFGR